jgi:carboxylate-amine ligase
VGAPLSSTPSAAHGWAEWQPSFAFTIGVEEEAMLLDPGGWELAQRIEDVLPRLGEDVAGRYVAETHQAAVELNGRPHATVGAAIAELADLRARLEAALAPLGLRAGAAGMHPIAVWSEMRVSESDRFRLIHHTMRELARREPTFALHVHVGVPDPEDAVRLMTALRARLPLLLALSASSPFWQGRDSGLDSARTILFGAFPRTGLPGRVRSYADWTRVVDALLRGGAVPEPTLLWWDVRLQPRFGTVEVRVMDAQRTLARTATLVALVQALSRWALLEHDGERPARPGDDEVLAENRFLAARDGVEAELVDAAGGPRRPVRDVVAELVEAVRPHAVALGCDAELDGVGALLDDPEPARHRALARLPAGLPGLTAALAEDFVGPCGRARPAAEGRR